jgi:hypothetical protein
VIAFAVSYTWSAAKNNCDAQCQVPSSLPLCGNQARPDLIEKWRGMGKKVIMSFGGAGMGGSWSGKFTYVCELTWPYIHIFSDYRQSISFIHR